MKQLTGIDAGFLYMETPTTFGHINSLSIYERPTTRGFSPHQSFRAQIAGRLDRLEPFRRRLVEVPFGLDHPWWVDDPDFDLDYHIRRAALPAPGGDAELSDLVARIIGQPMDRSRPLWEAYVIEGLPQRRWAVLLKIHHATVDGAAGAELLTMLLDDKATPVATGDGARELDDGEPETRGEPATGRASRSDDVPGPAEMLGRTALNFARRPERLARAQYRAWWEAAQTMATAATEAVNGLGSGPTPGPELSTRVAPPTPFNRSITSHRRFAFRSCALDDVKRIKHHSGATVNDVVMAVCAGALRQYLAGHDALPDQPLLAAVPVSIRSGDEPERWTNRVSAIVAPLPTHLDDRQQRLAATHEAMIGAKTAFDLVPADALQDLADFSPPALFTLASAAATRLRLADLVNPTINLVISNVPGPRHALYLGPAKLAHYVPVSTIAEGQGLNITVQSYEDKLDFGLVGCRQLVPDIEDLADLLTDELAALLEAISPKG